MRPIRVIVPSTTAPAASLAQHVLGLQKAGHGIVLLTADRPLRSLNDILGQAGLDLAAVKFIDVVSCMDGGAPPARTPNTVFLQSPTMLEMMAMRIEQMASREKDAVVVIDSLSTLALYNGAAPVQEFAHYLANRLRTQSIAADFVVRDNQLGLQMREKLQGFTDAHILLGATA